MTDLDFEWKMYDWNKKTNRLKLGSIVLIVLLIAGLISFLYFKFGGALEDTKDYNTPEQTESNIDAKSLSLEEDWVKARDRRLSLKRYIEKSPEDLTSDVNNWCIGANFDMTDCSSGQIIKEYNPNKPFILTLRKSNQPVTGIVYSLYNNGNLAWETEYLNGLKNGIGIFYIEEGVPCQQILWENGKIKQRKLFKGDRWTLSNNTKEGAIFPMKFNPCY